MRDKLIVPLSGFRSTRVCNPQENDDPLPGLRAWSRCKEHVHAWKEKVKSTDMQMASPR